MLVFEFPQRVSSCEAAFVHVCVDAVDPPFGCILPDDIVMVIEKYRFLTRIDSNHEHIIIKFSQQVLVVEILVSINQRLLAVGLLNHAKKPHKRVTEQAIRQIAS